MPSSGTGAVADLLGMMFGEDMVKAMQGALLSGRPDGVVAVVRGSSNAALRVAVQAAFETACARNRADVAGLALACGGIDADAAPKGSNSTLCRAAKAGQVELVQVLVDYKDEGGSVDTNHAGPAGWTPSA